MHTDRIDAASGTEFVVDYDSQVLALARDGLRIGDHDITVAALAAYAEYRGGGVALGTLDDLVTAFVDAA